MSEVYTKNELRTLLLQSIRGLSDYWISIPNEDGSVNSLETIDKIKRSVDGTVGSILNLLDGNGGGGAPGFALVPIRTSKEHIFIIPISDTLQEKISAIDVGGELYTQMIR